MKQRANLRSPLFLQYESRPAEVESENLHVYSEDFRNSAWGVSNGSVTSNAIEAPNGELTADKFECTSTASGVRFFDSFNISTDSIITLSIYAKRGNSRYFGMGLLTTTFSNYSRVIFDLQEGVALAPEQVGSNVAYTDYKSEKIGDGWYRLSLTCKTLSQTALTTFIYGVTESNSYQATQGEYNYFWGIQAEQQEQATSYIKTTSTTVVRAATTAAQEEDVTAELRIYSGGGGYDYERTNLAVYSNEVTSANGYALTNGTLTQNTHIAPDGTLTASTFKATATNGRFQNNNSGGTIGTTYTVSAYVKRKTGSGPVYIRSVEFGNILVTATDEWTRVSATVTSTSNNIRYGMALGTANDEIYVWGFQAEEAVQATSLIKTEATTVTELAYQTEAPTEATYTLVRTPNDAKATFEVSELVRDYIEQTLENTSGTTWLEVALSDSIQLPRHYHFLCTEGYIDNTEGLQTYLNAPSNETFMQSNATILIPEGESLELPVNAQYNSFYTITTGGVEGSAVYFSNLDDNTTQVEYITVNSTDEVVKLYVDSIVTEEITIQETECSKYANNKLLFVNKYGAKQEFYVNMKSTEKIRVKDDGFSRNVIDYANLSVTNGLHSYKRRVLESKEMHTLNTPFLDEENVQAFEELLLSEYVWYKKEGGDYIPVIIKDSNMTRKTHLNDKLIQYTIEVESANNLINIQR